MSVHRGLRALAALVVLSVLPAGTAVASTAVAGSAVAGTAVAGTAVAGTAVAGTIASGGALGTVFIQTAPALGGVRLLVGSSTVTTRPNGSAMVTVADINRIAARVSLASSMLNSRTKLSLAYVKAAPHVTKYQWKRVTDGVWVRTAAVPESHLTIGLDVSSKVTLRISKGTSGVAPSQVHAVRLHSVTGQTMLVDPQRTPTISLLSRKTRLVGGVLTPQVITWSVDSLSATPAVAITTARAKFDPLFSSVWPLLLRPVRGTVLVDTVPATPGVSFLLDGATFTTNAHGQGTSSVADLNGVELRLRTSTAQATRATVSILRVTRLTPTAPFQRHLVAALAVSRPVSLSFTDSAGRAVSAQRIAEVQLSGGGSTVTVSGAQLQDPISVLSNRAKLVDGTWEAQQVTYSVARVTVEGSDAVFTGQQRFNPNAASNWPISVSVFDVSVTVRDVLFGSRVTSAAEVTRPDGLQYGVQLGGDGPTLLPSLVRGEYTFTTQAAVLGASSKILVSKSSDAELRVLTLPDLLVLVLLMLGMSVSVVMIGRRRIRGSSSRRAAKDL